MKAVLIQYEIIDTILAFAFLSHKYLIDILQTNRYNSDLFLWLMSMVHGIETLSPLCMMLQPIKFPWGVEEIAHIVKGSPHRRKFPIQSSGTCIKSQVVAVGTAWNLRIERSL